MKEILAALYHFIIHGTAPMYTVIYRGDFFFIDYWSFNHFVSGALLLAFFVRRGVRMPYAALLGALAAYEVVEFLFPYFAVNIFRPEIIPDQLTDIFIGLMGGLSARAMMSAHGAGRFRLQGTGMTPDILLDLMLSLLIALAWVGAYGYEYNIPFCNSPGVNWYALLLWWVWIMLTLAMHGFIERLLRRPYLAIFLTWTAYFSFLLVFEYIGYYVLGIRLVTPEGPLVFGVIHGTVALKIFYVSAGVFSVVMSRLLKGLRAGGRVPAGLSGRGGGMDRSGETA